MQIVFTYLVKQEEKTWDEFAISIDLLEKNVLSKILCNFKILIFSEGSPNYKANKIINYLKSRKKLSNPVN